MLLQSTRLALAAGICIATLTSCGGAGSAPTVVVPPPAPPVVREQGVRQFVGAVGETIDYAALKRDLFISPSDIAPDGTGNFYVADAGKILKVTPAGTVTQVASLPGSYYFYGAAVDKAGILYTTCGNAIYKMNPAGEFTLIAGNIDADAFADDKGSAARFHWPAGIVVSSDGALFVADAGNHRIRKIGPDGTVTTFAGDGTATAADGIGTAAGFENPRGLAIDSQGNLYVGDGDAVRKIAPDGKVTSLARGPGLFGAIVGPDGVEHIFGHDSLAVGAAGEVYAVGGNAVRVISPGGAISTLAGGTYFKRLTGITSDASGNLIVVDTDNYHQQIRKITLVW